jgi:alcohol dehydrogenase
VRTLGGERVELGDAPEPTPPEGGVVVRVRASGLCGSEMHRYRDPQTIDTPQTAGTSRPVR